MFKGLENCKYRCSERLMPLYVQLEFVFFCFFLVTFLFFVFYVIDTTVHQSPMVLSKQ